MTPMDPSVNAALSSWEPGGLSLLVFATVVGGLLAAILALTRLVNPPRASLEKNRPYECGVIPTAEPAFRYPAPSPWWPWFFDLRRGNSLHLHLGRFPSTP